MVFLVEYVCVCVCVCARKEVSKKMLPFDWAFFVVQL